jgi:sortase (surface protein transpeptidase)
VRLVRLLTAVAALLLAAVFLSGCGEEQAHADTTRRVPATRSTPPTTVDPWDVIPTQPVYHPTPVTLQAPHPARIDIPAVGIASDLVPLGFNADGSMQVPKHFAEAGWFADGPNPGETGPAVIAGHVDSTRGPAVFYRLKDLQAGNDIVVTRVDGTTATFRVARVETYEKQAFPTTAVFGPTPNAELRLVTCGGDFDWSKHSYKSNVVVFATLV